MVTMIFFTFILYNIRTKLKIDMSRHNKIRHNKIQSHDNDFIS